MSRRKHIKNNGLSSNPGGGAGKVTSNLAKLSLDELQALSKAFPAILQSKIQSSLESENLDDVVAANLFLEKSKGWDDQMKSIFFLPDHTAYSGRGYKDNLGRVSFELLQRMGNLYCVKNIITTRIEQVMRFLRFSTDEQKEGYTIRRKRSIFNEDDGKKLSREDKKEIERIVNFIERGGNIGKWDGGDTLITFVKKILFDSLTLDQLAFEIVRTRGFELDKFKAIDASMIRLLDAEDPQYSQDFEKYRYRGYLPKYCQVWNQQIVFNKVKQEYVLYYPWELGYGVRNQSTNIWDNGYGKSELESLAEIITYTLNSVQYNGNFFKNGSNPKGFLNIKDSNANQTQLNEFKQKWRQLLTGTENSHKIPVFQGLNVEWVDLHHNNREMEFDNWTKFLIVLTCSVYRIDPSELGFQFRDSANTLGQYGQKERLDHSKQKGLYPILVFLQSVFNHYLIEELNENFELVFTGMEIEDEEKQVKLDKEKVEMGAVSMEDMFMKYSGREFNPETDTILNSVYQQAQQAKMYGGEEMNGIVDEETGETGGIANPFADETMKSMSEKNPILRDALSYINTQFETE